MKRSLQNEHNLRKIVKLVEDFYPQSAEVDYEKFKDQLDLVRVLHQQQVNFVVVFDTRKFQPVFISRKQTFDEDDNDLSQSIQRFMSRLIDEHKNFPNVSVAWTIEILNRMTKEEKENLRFSYCGANLINPDGERSVWNINSTSLVVDENNNPLLALLLINNVSHLMKGKGYWFRFEANQNRKVCTYFSELNETHDEDIVSPRELEVLKLIAKGFDTKQIADKLDISPNTVDNHRRNMLARTGAKDTTALIQICILNGVL
ncbi:MAG: response regulator transcription factor [Spirosomataceae bacterium]